MTLLKEIARNEKIKHPVIYGLAGAELRDEEKYFFSHVRPIGFILFARNIQNKQQVKNLVRSLKELVDGEALILIDQEGGRVARLRGGEWRDYPAADYFAQIYVKDKKLAKKSCYENAAAIARDLEELGINLNCAPVLDISTPKTHKVIGDRAYGSDAKQVADLAEEVCRGFLDNNIYPVIKHIPGHGRADADSHLTLPIVADQILELENSDFLPFRHLAQMKFAMTAHILYSAIDNDLPATISKKVIDIIRYGIGFNNILMSDDLSMHALPGSFVYRTQSTLEAGCDLILHCNGNMGEMQEIHSVLPEINDELRQKLND